MQGGIKNKQANKDEGEKINRGAHRALPHSTVLPPIFCHSVDIDVVVMGTDGQEVPV